MKVCASCRAENPDTGKFCAECGSPLARTCPSCGAPAGGGKFCGECGTALDAAAPAPAPAAVPSATAMPLAERRITSVLFGDLVGFTTLSESRDPEDVRELLSRYFAISRTVIQRYGGVVEKFIGDAVMAVWGVPVAHEDDAERAVRAGLDLTDAIAALGEETGLSGLSMRVGVVTGEVAVTVGATGEGMVAGDAVNTASRVQSTAAPGRVWVDDQTRELTAAAIVYDDQGTHELKGKTGPVRLFEARQVIATVGGLRRVDGLEAPFSGRERELRLVRELFHATMEEGRPRLVAVYGAPGVGKSRLGWEFDKYTDGISFFVAAHRGRCLSYGEGVAFWALAELVRGRLGILEGDGTDVVIERLRQGLDEYVPDPDDRAWLLPRLATLLGAVDAVAPGASFERDDLFAAWRTFLERVAKHPDVVGAFLLIDDAQWADPALLEFVTHVLDFAQTPIYILVLARSELADLPPAFANSRRATAIHLEPLPSGAMEVVVDGLVNGLPGTLRAALVERAEGIPLFAVETVRALIDRDAVIPKDGRYVLAPGTAEQIDLADQNLPTSLHTLIASRLDGLPRDERSVVQDAAVLGQSFSREGLAALVAAVGDAADVEQALTSLTRKEIFAVDSDPRSPERGNYRFVQAIVRTVAYDTLSRRDRKARHLAVARFLAEEPDAETISGVIASHYLDAHAAAASDDDAPELAECAVTLLERAAKQARELGAPAEARRHLETALGLVSDPAVVGRLAEAASRAAIASGSSADSAMLSLRAQQSYLDADLPIEAAGALALWGDAQIYMGHGLQVPQALAKEYEELAGRPEAAATTAALALVIARAYYLSDGQHAEAIEWFDRAVVLAEALDDIPLLSATLASYAGALVLNGRARMGLGLLQVSLDLARRTDNPVLQLRPLNNLVSFLAARDAQEAREYADAALAIVRRLGDRDWGLYVLGSATHVYWNVGAWDEALAAVQEGTVGSDWSASPLAAIMSGYECAIQAARGLDVELPEVVGERTGQHGDALLQATAQFLAAARARVEGNYEVAAAQSRIALEGYHLASGIDDDFPVFWYMAVEDQLALGRADVARTMVGLVDDKMLGLVPALQAAMLPWLRARAADSSRDGHDDEADYQLAATRLRQFGAPFYLGRALLDHAEWLDAQGRHGESEPLRAEARELFEKLGATRWLERAGGATTADADAKVSAPGVPAGT